MKLPSIRFTDFLAFLLCCILIGSAIYIEETVKLEPCALCIFQRIVFAILGLLFLIGSLFKFKQPMRRFYHLFTALVAFSGVFLATKQVWLEHLPPDQVPTCGASLKYLFQILPVQKAIQVALQGSGSCAKVTWRLLGFSIPSWSLLFFVLLAALSIWQAFRNKKS